MYLGLMPKKIKTVVVGPFQVNCFLYWDSESCDGVIIDPGAEAERIFKEIDAAGITPRAILLTHGHADHIVSVKSVKDRYDIPLYIGNGEQELLSNPSDIVSTLFEEPIVVPEPDVLLSDEQIISFGSLSLRVLLTPGHSPAGVCYLDETAGNLFCGDTLFDGSIGRTDLQGGSLEVLLDSIRRKILSLPDSVVCYPGHGPQTTVGSERVNNPFLVGGSFA